METTRNRCLWTVGRIGSVFTLGLALALFGTSADAGPGDNNPLNNTFSDPNGEEVGTLPSIAATTSLWLPSIVLTGTQDDVFALVAELEGLDPAVGVSTLVDGRTRFVLYGDVSVTLDRAVLAQGAVEVSLQVGQMFAGGVSQASWNGERNPLQLLPAAGDVRLGVGAFAAPGADDGTASLSLVSPRRLKANIAIAASGNRIQMDVQHPE